MWTTAAVCFSISLVATTRRTKFRFLEPLPCAAAYFPSFSQQCIWIHVLSPEKSRCCFDLRWTRSFLGMPGPMTNRRKMAFDKMLKRNKVRSFDNLIQRQKPLRRVLMLKNVLANHPSRAMLAGELGRVLEAAGQMMQTKAVYLLGKYPGIFKLHEIPLWDRPFVKFTNEAEMLVKEEDRIREGYEPVLIEKITRLLMMSIDRRLRLDHVCKLDQEFGLSFDFRTRVVNKYPEIFKVVKEEDCLFLELTSWNDSLALTTREVIAKQRPLHNKKGEALPFGFPLFFPKGHRQCLEDRQKMNIWQKLSFISPYARPAGTNLMAPEAGKRAVAVVHEFLCLTVEKMTSVEHLDLLRKQFKLPCRLYYFLNKHYGIFYVTKKDSRHVVFLKEAYKAIDHPAKVAQLIFRCPHILLNERFEKLMEAPESGLTV